MCFQPEQERDLAFGPLPVSPHIIGSHQITWVLLSPIYGAWGGAKGEKTCEKGSPELSEQWRVHSAGDCGGETE